MCFLEVALAVVSAATTALGSVVSQKMSMDAQNSAAANAYNQQARMAEQANRAAIKQQTETDSRNRIERGRLAESAADKTRAAILENRRAMATARASAGTSGMMGLPLNMIEQNYQSLIGGQATNLASYNQQLDENYFFESMNSMLQAQNITNQSIPMKPQMQKFGAGNWLAAGLGGLSSGLGTFSAMGGFSGGGGGGGTGGGTSAPKPAQPYNPETGFWNSSLT